MQTNAIATIVNALACVIASSSYHFVIAVWRAKAAECPAYVKRYWEIVADNLHDAGWS